MRAMKTLVVLPSYNERQNVVDLVEAILASGPDRHVCVVDDSSPDGTWEQVADAIRSRPGWPDRVVLIVRSKKDGRGGAVREGFFFGLRSNQNYAAYVEMDCDFSHEPTAISEGLALLEDGFDLVIGSRYPNGIIIGWPLRRRIFSFLANLLARLLIDWSIADYTNGFRFYRRRAVETMLAHDLRYKGYIYLSESLSHLLHAGMTVASFPIRFKNRERGVSNTSLREIRTAFQGILSIGWQHRFSK